MDKTLPSPDTPVEELKGLGPKSADWLREAGVETYNDLQSIDLLILWAKLKSRRSEISKNMYYGLWGALNNKDWREIPADEKKKLEMFISEQGIK